MKKQSNSEKTGRIKKQLTSAGVYIALAAVVIGITSNGVRNIIGGNSGYESPDFELESESYDFISLDDTLPKQAEHDLPQDYFVPDTSVSESPENISSRVDDPEYTEQSVLEENVTDTEPVITEPTFDGGTIPTVRVKPVDGYITREYSETELLYTPTMNDFRTHNGVDLASDIGTGVAAFADGIITEIYTDDLMGVTVVIKHSGGLVSCYRNLSESLSQTAVVGNTVKAGEIIGGVGESAIIESADVPHLHFELYLDEECINPEDYFIG